MKIQVSPFSYRDVIGGSTMMALMFAMLLFAQSAGELYQQALVQENGVGDLKKAIELYERAVKEAKDDRTMAALALEGAARSREKLGLAERGIHPTAQGQLASLNREYFKLLGEYEAMATKYAPEHPALRPLVQRIGDMARTLHVESQRQGLVSIAPNVFAAQRTDPDEEIQFTGVVHTVQWTNPHVTVGVEVQEPNGNRVGYTLQGTNPNGLLALGIMPKLLKLGETVMVEGLRSRATPLVVGFATITTSNGLKIFLGNSNFP